LLGATSDRLPVKDWKYDRPVPGDALEATVRVLRSALTVIIKLFVRPVEFTVCAIKEAASSGQLWTILARDVHRVCQNTFCLACATLMDDGINRGTPDRGSNALSFANNIL
jgi:hypothetical protein